jgi:SAM-dependent methyltransferase
MGVLAVTSAAAWALPIVGLWLLVEGLGASLGLGGAAEAFSVGTFLGALSLIPLGSGVTGTSVIVHLTSLGVPPEESLFAGAMLRAGTTWYAFGLGMLLLWIWRREILGFAPARPQAHFDELAESYEGQIPAHIRARLVDRKLDAMERWLRDAGLGQGARGLDVGCGQGWYAVEMARRGFAMAGFDASSQQVARVERGATGARVGAFVASAEALPHPDESFDFAYAINVFHHITEPAVRVRGLREIARVLKPGGLFFLHEINTQNPLFEFYMGYVFPLLREIDDGTEAWLKPTDLPAVPGARWADDRRYLTFLPDFLPAPLLSALGPLERGLEASRLRGWSAHYVAALVKEPV